MASVTIVPDEPRNYLKPEEVAMLLDVSTALVYDLIDTCELPAVRVPPGRKRVYVKAFYRFLADHLFDREYIEEVRSKADEMLVADYEKRLDKSLIRQLAVSRNAYLSD